MSDIAIKVENLSKMYRLGTIGTGSLGSDITRWWATVRGKEDPYSQVAIANDRSQKANSDYVWSLKDIDFEIKKGDAVGIIGRNGAGKSTLLKILSRVTSPTTGSVKINGRVASLLEVGTGFSPDLTGKENIYMNGSILGMQRAEITSKLEEIIEFSGVSGYIDTPVKRYSSGMYVRLAFAVAAHLDPEIMIVDEVLAVGDAEFQKKCLGKMQDVNNKEGRTILFVSHNMAAIKNFCTSGILLNNGHLDFYDKIEPVLQRYVANQNLASQIKISEVKRSVGNGTFKFTDLVFRDKDGKERKEFFIGEYMEIVVHFEANEDFYNCRSSRIDIGINDFLDNRIVWLSTFIYQDTVTKKKPCIVFSIEKILLNQGAYNVNLFCNTDRGIADWIQNASKFDVTFNDFYGTGRHIPENQGYIFTEFKIG